jgi:hypothetical protein
MVICRMIICTAATKAKISVVYQAPQKGCENGCHVFALTLPCRPRPCAAVIEPAGPRGQLCTCQCAAASGGARRQREGAAGVCTTRVQGVLRSAQNQVQAGLLRFLGVKILSNLAEVSAAALQLSVTFVCKEPGHAFKPSFSCLSMHYGRWRVAAAAPRCCWHLHHVRAGSTAKCSRLGTCKFTIYQSYASMCQKQASLLEPVLSHA